jgi:segregation and condensation protein B
MQRRRLRTAGLLPAPVDEPASDAAPIAAPESTHEAAPESAETLPVDASRPERTSQEDAAPGADGQAQPSKSETTPDGDRRDNVRSMHTAARLSNSGTPGVADEDISPATFSRPPRLPHTFPTQSVPVSVPPVDQGARDEATDDETTDDEAVSDAPPPHAGGSNGAGPPLTELHALVESLLFVSGEPVAAAQLARALEVDEETVASALRTLAAAYASHNRGLRVQMHRNKYQIVTAPAAASHIERFLDLDTSSKLSGPALETLAVIAYRQPVTRSQIEAVRGVDCAAVLRSLTQRGLVEEVGRLDVVGRPILYGVTDFFLQHFGLTDLEELPPLEQDEADTLWASTALADLPESTTFDEARDEDRQQPPNTPVETPIQAQDTSG